MRNTGTTSSPFIKYGCIKDHKFGERMIDCILYKNLEGKYLTIQDLVKEDETTEEAKESEEKEASPETETKEEEKEKEKTVIVLRDGRGTAEPVYQPLQGSRQWTPSFSATTSTPPLSPIWEQLRDNLKFQRIDADVNDSIRRKVTRRRSRIPRTPLPRSSARL